MDKKFALITGTTTGIGHELAKLFAQDGYNLVCVARPSDKLYIENNPQQWQQDKFFTP